MKTFNIKAVFAVLALAVVSLFVSCSDDDGASGGAPVINSVSLAQNDSLVEYGYANNMYIIRGKGFTNTQKIYFNETDTYFNSTLVTDEVILVTIDRNTPYENTTEELKVVTPGGTATYHFVVAPPAPAVTSFQPVNAADGAEITIYGSFFLDPVVTIGGVEAEIVSSTLTKIVAVVPAGSNHKYVTVTTISGESEWGTAIGTAIYDDAFYAPWDIESWNNHEYVTDQEKAYQGTTFIKKEMSGWGNLQGNWAWNDQLSQYTGIHFWVRSDDAAKLQLIFNGSWDDNTAWQFTTSDQWQEVRFTWAQLGSPAALQNISFKEFTGATHNYYFDNFGYTID
ncbi:IPT/TIG domain-containing protein [Flavobacterium akiainvivens]|uniref:IPT/TIG domain-containing protein n=1 Tax=Flavobacterium akiainvivens TaxID=1202724 RepID=UPI0006C89557|nr:IPT/TIG domain-containing protein [Flavobacterium akiainvivens]SFQ56629.1 hypothetical protein SAMN05444144_10862 [Flavobacterium akiainvivens]